MRKSRVLLAGVAVAAAGVATSAFTASNTFTNGSDSAIIGYGATTVSGATITGVHYVRDTTDQSILARIVWDTSSDLTALDANAGATMTLKKAGLLKGNYTCLIAGDATGGTVTCDVGGTVTFEDFDSAGLAVGGE
jgi:hypothetical protein